MLPRRRPGQHLHTPRRAQARFDTGRHPRTQPNQRPCETKSPGNPPQPLRHCSTPHAPQNQRPAKRIPAQTRPTRSTLFDTPRPTESTPCETKCSRTRPPRPNPSAATRSAATPPAPAAPTSSASAAAESRGSTLFDTSFLVKTTACKAVALVTGCKPCSGQRPARWVPHQAGFKK